MAYTNYDRWKQIQRRWVVVAVVTLFAVLGAIGFALTARETYTAKSTLILSGRTPDQDAVMTVGYLTLFNDPAAVDRLKATIGLPENVTAEARTAGASPILNILATADDPVVAQNAAERMALTFISDINATQRKGKDERLADLERQLGGVAPLAPDGSANPYFTALQTQVNQVKSDPTNELMVLQARAGVNENAPNTALTVIAGALGGLLLGILMALGLAVWSRRPADAIELRQRTGIEVLAEVPAAGSAKREIARRQRFRALANVVSIQGPPTPSVIAVTATRSGSQAREVAKALALSSAQQGSRTILVYADNEPNTWGRGIGFNDALVKGGLGYDVLNDGDSEFPKVVPSGSILADRYSLITHARVGAIFDELRALADTIVVVAPSVSDIVEAPVLCAAADVTILVVSTKSRFADLTSAVGALKMARARLLGAVMVGRGRATKKRSSAGFDDLASSDSTPETERIVVPFRGQRTSVATASGTAGQPPFAIDA